MDSGCLNSSTCILNILPIWSSQRRWIDARQLTSSQKIVRPSPSPTSMILLHKFFISTASSLNFNIIITLHNDQNLIHGPTLFGLKYRVIPCMMSEDAGSGTGGYNDVFVSGMNGVISNVNRGPRWCEKRRQGGMYHSTRYVHDHVWCLRWKGIVTVPLTFSTRSTRSNDIHFCMSQATMPSRNTLCCRSCTSTWEITCRVRIDDSGHFITQHNCSISMLLQSRSLKSYELAQSQRSPAWSRGQELPLFQLGSGRDPSAITVRRYTYVQIFHVPQSVERAHTLLQQLSKFKLFPESEATLQMVCHSDSRGFYTSSIRMKKPHITDLRLHYGDEFADIHEELMENLQEKDSSGITFLHGLPGTGKTYYLR